MCYEALPPKLYDAVEYYQATQFMVFSVTHYSKLHNIIIILLKMSFLPNKSHYVI